MKAYCVRSSDKSSDLLFESGRSPKPVPIGKGTKWGAPTYPKMWCEHLTGSKVVEVETTRDDPTLIWCSFSAKHQEKLT